MSSEANGTGDLHSLLMRYDMALLRKVADDLLRARLQRGREDLIGKMTETVANPAVIDRRLRDLDAPQRGLLALLGLGRRARWELVTVLEILSSLGAPDGLAAVRQLFEAGLLYPDLPENGRLLRSFKQWLPGTAARQVTVFAPPAITSRAVQRLGWSGSARPSDALPPLTVGLEDSAHPTDRTREADGLEWFLRLGVLWQQVHAGPLRLTQQGEFFKKDHERLAADALLAAPAADEVTPPLQWGHGLVALALAAGVLRQEDGQILAGDWPEAWNSSTMAAIGHVWSLLPDVHAWNAGEGWRGLHAGPSPYDSARLFAVGLLAQLPPQSWVAAEAIGAWITEHHCFWHGKKSQRVPSGRPQPAEAGRLESALSNWANAFLLGMAYQLRLVQASQSAEGHWLVRLSPFGRAVLGLGEPPTVPAFPRTLLVQPNLEILAYRQGLTPGLIAGLSCCAAWQNLGAACTLRLQPETVYRGLESGYGLEQIVRLLVQHGVRELPPGVHESLRTWANKRERLTVYSAATLLEFTSADEAQTALNRGLAGRRITDRLVLVSAESDIDFRQYRLTGTRDYALPPGRCVEVAADGVTLLVDSSRSDLLLDTEIQRFAAPHPEGTTTDRQAFRVTPLSIRQGLESGLTLFALEEWFLHRTGQALSAAIRLLLAGNGTSPLEIRRPLLLETPTPQLADGLMQWPETRELIRERLGPRALVIDEDHFPALQAKLRELQLSMRDPLADRLPASLGLANGEHDA